MQNPPMPQSSSTAPLSDQTPLSDRAREKKWRDVAVRTWACVGVCVLVGVCVYLLNILAIPFGIILWTVVFVFILNGLVNFLQKHGINRVLGTAIAYVVMFAVLAFIFWLIFNPQIGIGAQFTSLVDNAPGYIAQLTDWVNGIYTRYASAFQGTDAQQIMNSVLNAASGLASDAASNSANYVLATGNALVNTAITVGFALVVAFWMLIDMPRLEGEIRRLMGNKRAEDADMLYATFTRVMGGYIKGTIIQCAIIGVASGVFFAFLGVPSPGALGAITGILNIIPIVGPWLGGGMAFLVSVFVSPLVAVVALIGTIIIQQVVYMLVSPKVMGSAVDIHPALMMVALVAGSAIGGAMAGTMGSLVGALLSIPIVAALKSIFVYYFEKREGRRLATDDGVFFVADASADEPPDPMADATGIHAREDAARGSEEK